MGEIDFSHRISNVASNLQEVAQVYRDGRVGGCEVQIGIRQAIINLRGINTDIDREYERLCELTGSGKKMTKLSLFLMLMISLTGCVSLTWIHIDAQDGGRCGDVLVEMVAPNTQHTETATEVRAPGM